MRDHGSDMAAPLRVLVTGATGYIGARLVPRLLEVGHEVRAMGRSMSKLRGRPWATDPRVELVTADVNDEVRLAAAVRGCDIVYYLVHSMQAHGKRFAQTDRRAAKNVAEAAALAGVSRIIYLGGLGVEGSGRLSEHLRSRHEVGRVLASGSVPVTEFRAAVIIGSGSASFEILRYLTERLPVMITPRWVSTPVQPIAVRDVLAYLVDCLRVPETSGRIFEIGGPEVMTYRELMQMYAQEAGLRKRAIIPVPVLTPRLSSYWVHLVTPAPASLARPLADGLRNPVIVSDDRIRGLIPRELIPAREAIRLAMDRLQHETMESHWTDASGKAPAAWSYDSDPDWTGGTILQETRSLVVPVAPPEAWAPISRIGGEQGYYYADGLWRARGAIDSLVGGVGLRRGRAYPATLRAGDALDFWRISDVEPGRRVRLVAEMKLPGEAMLEFEIAPENGGTRITQTASFLPRGLAGLAYWHALLPLHRVIFRGMLDGIAREATRSAGSRTASSSASPRSG